MGILSALRPAANRLLVDAPDIVLRTPEIADYAAWRQQRLDSREFLEPWEPLWNDEDHAPSNFRFRLRRYREAMASDTAYPFFLFSKDADQLLGAVTLANVRRGVADTATLGYWIGSTHARQGHMTKALAALLPYAFRALNLHRIEAACLPTNQASISLLQRSGFEREGYARSYLRIAGRWEDHILFAKRSPEA